MKGLSLGDGLRLLCGGLAVICLLLPVTHVRAENAEEVEASANQIRANVAALRKRYLNIQKYRGAHYAESRLVDGENYYELKDYQRASIILLDVIENFPNHAAFPEALFYYADSLFLSRDFYGARTEFQRLLNMGEANGYAPFRSAAISRLVEVAVHLDDFTNVDKYIGLLGRQPGPGARYIKGKYFYFQKKYEEARAEFGAVTNDEELELKAAYFIGAIFVKEERIDDAITVFKGAVEKFPQVASEHRNLLDLLFLAYGRVLYEKDDLENAIAAYQHVDKFSTLYDVALYELAAVHLRAGNTIGAERILEVLTMAIPDSRYIPEAKLLRGQLLSSAGRYTEAEAVFEQTISEFSPVQQMMDKALSQSGDTGVFFELLMARSVNTLDMQSMIPREVVIWAGEEPDVKRAFVLTDDLGKAKEYTGESSRLVELISAVVNGTHPVNAIPMLRNAMRQTQQLNNQLMRLQVSWMRNLEGDVDPARIASLAKERARLEKKAMHLPIDDRGFAAREKSAKKKYTDLRLELARYETMLDKLQAVSVGLERYIEKPEYRAEVPPQVLEGYWSQLSRYQVGAVALRSEIDAVKMDLEKASYQVGVGGPEDKMDKIVSGKIDRLIQQYARLIDQSGRKSTRYRSALNALQLARESIDGAQRDIESTATRQVDVIRKDVEIERSNLLQYQAQLEALNTEAKEVVNGVAKENFSSIRKKFEELMIKADVGIIDIAWMKKEEHKNKAVQLSRLRTDEMQWLDEEFTDLDGFTPTAADASGQ